MVCGAAPPSAGNATWTVTPVTVSGPWLAIRPSTNVDFPPDRLSDSLICRPPSCTFGAYAADSPLPPCRLPMSRNTAVRITSAATAMPTAVVGNARSARGSANRLLGGVLGVGSGIVG